MRKEHSAITKIFIVLGLIAVFVIGLTLVVLGQQTVGYKNLTMMIVGLSMLLSLVYLYNRKYNVLKKKSLLRALFYVKKGKRHDGLFPHSGVFIKEGISNLNELVEHWYSFEQRIIGI